LQARLQEAGIVFTVLRHQAVFTSEEAAAVRGAPLASGAKALVMKANEDFVMLILPADRKLDSKKAKTGLGVKSVRFATREEVAQLTGLQPGSIPPFGSLFNLSTCCDPALALNETINFNAGDHCISVQMSYKDFVAVEKPRMLNVT
jgi:Ala-tRNA(Pro) deacylase